LVPQKVPTKYHIPSNLYVKDFFENQILIDI
jgi:hypothetical protein